MAATQGIASQNGALQPPFPVQNPNFPVNTTTTGYNYGTRSVFHTDYAFFAGAIIVQAVCIVLIAPTYWGWWRLGRSVSFSPLEIAKVCSEVYDRHDGCFAYLCTRPSKRPSLLTFIPILRVETLRRGTVNDPFGMDQYRLVEVVSNRSLLLSTLTWLQLLNRDPILTTKWVIRLTYRSATGWS